MHMYTCIDVYINIYLYIYPHTYTYLDNVYIAHGYTCIYIYTRVYMCVCVCQASLVVVVVSLRKTIQLVHIDVITRPLLPITGTVIPKNKSKSSADKQFDVPLL